MVPSRSPRSHARLNTSTMTSPAATLSLVLALTCTAGSSAAPFADNAALKTAVENCLAVESSGLNCCSRATDAANCGAAGQSDMSGWDVSMVTDMAGLFQQKFSFNQDISAWNVSHVTDMQSMFDGAVAFNADISKWNTMA